MNRIILIGNGFDLAHGLKTSYKDFIEWYLVQRVKGFSDIYSSESKDELLGLTLNGWHWYNYWWSHNHKYRGKEFEHFQSLLDSPDVEVWMSDLFKRIYTNYCEKQWVDIEQDYYELLCEKNPDGSYKGEEYAKDLNRQMNAMKEKLTTYLLAQQKEKDACPNPDYIEPIYGPIRQPKEVSGSQSSRFHLFENEDKQGNQIELIDSVFFLNFNYTTTEYQYFITTDIIWSGTHIHGKLPLPPHKDFGELEKPNPIIFGYGDEIDSKFKELQNLNQNAYLENFKSIRYLETDNYRRLLQFIESGPYQVCIMGHSCGLSDRTLLNTLFEHDNCVSIKPFYYVKEDGTDNYMELVMNISRNFNNMKKMRDRVVNKEQCQPMPQYNNKP